MTSFLASARIPGCCCFNQPVGLALATAHIALGRRRQSCLVTYVAAVSRIASVHKKKEAWRMLLSQLMACSL